MKFNLQCFYKNETSLEELQCSKLTFLSLNFLLSCGKKKYVLNKKLTKFANFLHYTATAQFCRLNSCVIKDHAQGILLCFAPLCFAHANRQLLGH